MKTSIKATLPILGAAMFCLGANSQPQLPDSDKSAETDSPTADGTAETTTNSSSGLLFHFRHAPLESVLTYMSRAAGFVVYLRPGVTVTGSVDAWTEKPVSEADAVAFLKTVLSDQGLSVIQNRHTLSILRTSDSTYETSIKLGSNPDLIPDDAEVVTQIIPVRNLNPVELGRVLPSLLPASARIEVNESANALLITDAQSNVKRAASIIAALDSVTASANTLKVFPLRYGDARALSDIIKEIYAPADSARGNGNTAVFGLGTIPNFGGARGQNRFGNGFGPNNGSSGAGETPVSRVSATADEHANAVVVSAPEALLADIGHLIDSLDVPVADDTETEVIHLQYADCTDLANLLQSAFPGDDSSSDASGTQTIFNGQGNIGGARTAGARQGTPGTGESSRMKKLGRVLVVPDPRTSSLIVNAADSLMQTIRAMVSELDRDKGNNMATYVIHLNNADPQDALQLIQSLYSSQNNASTSSSSDILKQRTSAMLNTFFSSSGTATLNLNSGSATGARNSGL